MADWTVPVLREHLAKLDAVFRYYQLDPEKRPWEKLCWRLLRDFVPGFQYKKRAQGRPLKWSAEADLGLVADVDRLKNEGFSVQEACRFLAGRQAYRNFGSKVALPAWSTLEGRYKKAKRKLKASVRESREKGNMKFPS
jgi:hypothetical protein